MIVDYSNTAGQRFRDERMKQKLSLRQLAEKLHASKGEIGKIETGKRKLTVDWIIRLCNGLGLDHKQFILEMENIPHHSKSVSGHVNPDRHDAEKETNLPQQRPLAAAKGDFVWASRDLPVKARIGPSGEIVLVEGGRAVGYTHRPPQLANDKDAFAVPAPADNSMSPMYKPGQMVMVSNFATLLPGFGVFVACKNGRAQVRELVKNTAAGVMVRSYQPKKTYLIPAKQITEILRIVGVMDGTF